MNHLRGFYRRILLWFWLAAALLLGTVLVTASVTVTPLESLPTRTALYKDLTNFSEQVRLHLLVGESVAESLAAVEAQEDFPEQLSLVMISPDGGWVSYRQNPEFPVLQGAQALVRRNVVGIANTSSQVMIGPGSVEIDGEEWHLLMVWQHQALLWNRLVSIINGHPILIVMSLLASAFLCFLLVTGLISPLRTLQRQVREIADGDLQTRLPEGLTQRNDEVGELCRDFNVMAERLEVTDQTKQQLLRNVSHELRSPLTRMQLSLVLARSKSKDLASSELDRMERDIERLNGMIGQLLQWSRMITAFPDPSREVFSLDEAVKELIDNANFEAAMHEKAVMLTRCDSSLILGGQEWLSSAVENIVRNAIRFSPKDGRVEVSLTSDEHEARVVVRDYGPGVPEDELNSLFEPFYRVDETRGGDNSGTGLGMAIAQAAVASHEGSIVAENAAPGLRITITLPLNVSDLAA